MNEKRMREHDVKSKNIQIKYFFSSWPQSAINKHSELRKRSVDNEDSV